MKSITIAGNIGKDAETRTMQDGTKVTGWSVAVDDGFGDRKRTIWFDCSMWGQRGAKLAQFLTKGTKVAVSGDLSTREHDGKTYLTVRVNEVTLQGGGRDGGGQPSGGGYDQSIGAQGGAPAGGAGGGLDDLGDEVPFMCEWRCWPVKPQSCTGRPRARRPSA